MARKPKRVYDPALGRMVSIDSEQAGIKPETINIPSRQVYSDGGNVDRRSITQQVVEFTEERRLRLDDNSLTKYNELLHTIYDAVFMTDNDGNINDCNARAEHYFAQNRDELRQRNIIELISGADQEIINIIHENVGQKRYTVLEAICSTEKGVRFYAEIVVNQLKSAGHKGLCFIIRDISPYKQAEKELKKANEMLVEAEKTQARVDTISTLIHEINNPLQILTCMAELDKNSKYKEQLDRIVEVLNRLGKEASLETVVDSSGFTRYEINNEEEQIGCDFGRILIVDDEEVLRDLFVSSLSSAFPDTSVDPAADGKTACLMFENYHYGVIIMDIAMPLMDGETAFLEIESICERNNWERPSFLFITGFDISDNLRSVIGNNPSHACLQKPVAMSKLIEAIKSRRPR